MLLACFLSNVLSLLRFPQIQFEALQHSQERKIHLKTFDFLPLLAVSDFYSLLTTARSLAQWLYSLRFE